jgi:hypothetical protein
VVHQSNSVKYNAFSAVDGGGGSDRYTVDDVVDIVKKPGATTILFAPTEPVLLALIAIVFATPTPLP